MNTETKTNNEAKLMELANEIVNSLKKTKEGGRVRSGDTDPAEMFHGYAGAAIRNWGSWELPNDAEEDEDDYDWKDLADYSHKNLAEYLAAFQKDHPELKIDYDVGEKEYVYIKVGPK